MSDIESIYEYLISSPKNGTNLEMLIKNISDTKMVMGLIIELWVKCDEYNIQKEDVVSVGASIGMNDMVSENTSPLYDLHKHFISEMSQYADRQLYLYGINADLLKHIITSESNGDISTLDHKLSTMSQEELLMSKSYFLEVEMYEYIKFFDKYIK